MNPFRLPICGQTQFFCYALSTPQMSTVAALLCTAAAASQGYSMSTVTATAAAAAARGAPPPAPSPPVFGFSPVFGDWMVLQQAPAAAAVYGTATASTKSVTVTVSDGKTSYDVVAKVGKDVTHQPIGYVVPGTGAQLPYTALTWKAVLHPATAGGDYIITAKCTGCTNTTTATLQHATFGDMWYCSGKITNAATTPHAART